MKPNRTYGEYQAQTGNLQPGYRQDPTPDDNFVAIDQVDGGMVTAVGREQVPKNSGRVVKNGRVKNGWVGRRPGTVEFGTNPDVNPVLGLATALVGRDITVLRLTKNSAHMAIASALPGGADVWAAVTHPYTGEEVKFSFAQYFDRLYIAENQGRLSYFDIPTKTISRIDTAPRGKFVTIFGDRVIVANLRDFVGGNNPTGIAWPVSADPHDWEGIGAGQDYLQGPAEITGIFGLESVMVVLREDSIWHGSRQPLASAPFRFSHVYPQGCDLPYSAAQGEGGIFFADYRSQGVYFYQPGAAPVRISEPVDDQLLADLKNLVWADGAFDPFTREYHLGICTSDGSKWINKTWVFSVKSKAWSYDDGPAASVLSTFVYPGTKNRINDLAGVINSLVGTIDELSASTLIPPTLFKGTPTGDVVYHSWGANTDYDATAFSFEYQSPNLGPSVFERTLKELGVKYEATVGGTLYVEVSRDETNWKHTKTRVYVPGEDQLVKIANKTMAGENLFWRIRATSGNVKVTGYWVRFQDHFGQQPR